MIYPAVVTVIALGVIAPCCCVRRPGRSSVYQQSRRTLPWLTQALIATSAFFPRHRVVLARGDRGGLGDVRARAGGLSSVHGGTRSSCAHAVVGRLLRSLDTARFASTLAIPPRKRRAAPALAGCGPPTSVRRIPPGEAARRAADTLVREGVVPLSRAAQEQKVFPPVLVHLVANGERAGAGTDARGAPRANSGDAERRLAWLAALLQPALIVIMGAIVPVLVLSCSPDRPG